ncbi:unnamed protein product [Trifolium pratense]|uniref:Uncharacterized protein n=1 Tax=Trifolium pratense TaxID=57577 RepID=A0ACB0L148_TRIPR|nr:unnamed protein product [Trifolium pratense]
MLEDVFVPKKRNKRGQPFGFVKFSNVRDVTKLLRALDNVYFGHYCVRARVASFYCNDVTASQRMETKRLGLTKGNVKPAMKECIDGNDIRIKSMGPQAKKGVGRDADPVKGGSGDLGAVRVGDIDVSLGARKEKVTRHNDQVHEEGHIPSISALPKAAIEEKDRQVLMRSYRTEPDDVSRAQNGLVATIINGMGLYPWEDTCLIEDDGNSETSQSGHEEGQGDPEVRHHIDTMVENFAKGMEEDDEIGSLSNFQLSNTRSGVEGKSEDARGADVHPSVLGAEHFVRSVGRVPRKGDSPLSTG